MVQLLNQQCVCSPRFRTVGDEDWQDAGRVRLPLDKIEPAIIGKALKSLKAHGKGLLTIK